MYSRLDLFDLLTPVGLQVPALQRETTIPGVNYFQLKTSAAFDVVSRSHPSSFLAEGAGRTGEAD